MLRNVNQVRLLLSSLLIFASLAVADFVPKWNRPEKPFRIADNVYYVGTNFLASYLITTPQGDILINPDFDESVPLIEKSVAALGRQFSNIKIILISHAHDDHSAGCARAKKDSGARLMVMAQDVPVVESGGLHDFAYTTRYAPAKVDRVLHDGDTVALGGTTLTAHLTAGHTKGCTSWSAEVKDHGRKLNMVIIGSLGVNPGYRLVDNAEYPSIASDYEQSFRTLRALKCDLFLGAHGSYYDMEGKQKRVLESGPNPFLDPGSYRSFIDENEKDFQKELEKQKAELTRTGKDARRSGGN